MYSPLVPAQGLWVEAYLPGLQVLETLEREIKVRGRGVWSFLTPWIGVTGRGLGVGSRYCTGMYNQDCTGIVGDGVRDEIFRLFDLIRRHELTKNIVQG